MEEVVHSIIQKHYSEKATSIVPLGGGFYGRVFLAAIPCEPYAVVIKIYLCDGLGEKEEMQIKQLAKSASIPMPQVYFLHKKDISIPHDILAMEYIDGVNAGTSVNIDQISREKIADKIIDNLIAYHQTINPLGFGSIGANSFEKDWRDYYRKLIPTIHAKAKAMCDAGKINHDVFSIVHEAYENFDKIFYLPIKTARLIHGDYNTWNVLLNKERTDTVAVIDPFNCCWADSEMDLYQLTNANGEFFNLMKKYKARMPVSENFEAKKSFYEVFTELMHFYDANVEINTSYITGKAEQLSLQMNKLGIIV